MLHQLKPINQEPLELRHAYTFCNWHIDANILRFFHSSVDFYNFSSNWIYNFIQLESAEADVISKPISFL